MCFERLKKMTYFSKGKIKGILDFSDNKKITFFFNLEQITLVSLTLSFFLLQLVNSNRRRDRNSHCISVDY